MKNWAVHAGNAIKRATGRSRSLCPTSLHWEAKSSLSKVRSIVPRCTASTRTDAQTERNGPRTQRRVSVAADLRSSGAMPCNARGVGWFHLSQGIEVSIAAAMLHTRPLPTAPPCCIHFTSSPLSTARTWILERDIHVQTANELSTRIFLARYLSL